MPELSCRCQSCDLRSSCAFYQAAIEPVIKVVEGSDYDLSDVATVAYLSAMTSVLNDFYCDQYE